LQTFAIIFPQTLACKQRSCVRGVDPAAVGSLGNVTPSAHRLQTFANARLV
jgi:hypothetical protein